MIRAMIYYFERGAWLQSTVILLMAPLLGVRIVNPANIILIYLMLFLFSVFFSALSTMIGLILSDHDIMGL